MQNHCELSCDNHCDCFSTFNKLQSLSDWQVGHYVNFDLEIGSCSLLLAAGEATGEATLQYWRLWQATPEWLMSAYLNAITYLSLWDTVLENWKFRRWQFLGNISFIFGKGSRCWFARFADGLMEVLAKLFTIARHRGSWQSLTAMGDIRGISIKVQSYAATKKWPIMLRQMYFVHIFKLRL